MILSDWLKPAREWATAASGLTRFPRILRVLQTGVTFALVCFSWIFFRARSVSDAWHIARGIFFGWSDVLSASGVVHLVYALRLNLREAAIMAACVGTLVLAHLVQSRGSVGEWIARQPVGLRWVSYSLLLWAIFLFGVFKSQEFIYFTF